MTIRIDRCVCTGQSFAALLKVARSQDLGLNALAKQTGACEQCGLCRQYLARTLQTGQVIFDDLIEPDPQGSDEDDQDV